MASFTIQINGKGKPGNLIGADGDLPVELLINILEDTAEALTKQMDAHFAKKFATGYPRPEVMDMERDKLTLSELMEGGDT